MKIEEILTDRDECPNVRFLDVDGLKATQSAKVILFLKELQKENFEIAIEVGTQQGGFSLLLREYLNCEIHTWDISDWEPQGLKRSLFQENSINFHLEDCFEDNDLLTLIQDKRKKIVFCDGGHKGNEFTFFAGYLQKGDFIGGHDYFEDGKINYDLWTTCELKKDHIIDAVVRHNLTEVYKESAKEAVWAMYKK